MWSALGKSRRFYRRRIGETRGASRVNGCRPPIQARLEPFMTTQPDLAAFPHAYQDSAASPSSSPPRIWPPVVLLCLFWPIYSFWRWTELGIALGFMGFLMLLGVSALVLLLFAIWWL